jgi:hypothetical protein
MSLCSPFLAAFVAWRSLDSTTGQRSQQIADLVPQNLQNTIAEAIPFGDPASPLFLNLVFLGNFSAKLHEIMK